jgi:hypothetical protein
VLGLDASGMSASNLTAGTINANTINIMNGNDATFVWDKYGISAYDWNYEDGKVDYTKFVRHDKYGIYGINGANGL